MAQLCDDEQMMEIMQLVETDSTNDVASVDKLLEEFREDPRLHFLRASILAGTDRLVEAHESMKRAVDLAPDFLIARFQLGFFELSSGEPQAALENWKPLEDLPDDHYLRRFVAGLTFLIQDEFQFAVNNLEAGIAINRENPPLNHDMKLIIEKCREILAADETSMEEGNDISAASLLLNQSRGPDHSN